jgi:hypothetical protein
MPLVRTAQWLTVSDQFIDSQGIDHKKLSQHADGFRGRFMHGRSQYLQQNEFFSLAWKLHFEKRAIGSQCKGLSNEDQQDSHMGDAVRHRAVRIDTNRMQHG